MRSLLMQRICSTSNGMAGFGVTRNVLSEVYWRSSIQLLFLKFDIAAHLTFTNDFNNCTFSCLPSKDTLSALGALNAICSHKESR
jgi:hypothetical protein